MSKTLSERLIAARAGVVADTPAKAVKKAKKVEKVERKQRKTRKARKTENRKPVANGTVEGHKCLVQKNRVQFIADHDWAQAHTSTSDLARAVLAGAPLTGVWALGPKTVARLTGVDESEAQAVTVESQGGAQPKVKKAKKVKKGKKVKATVVEPEPTITKKADGSHWIGDVRVTSTGKVMSEAQIAAADAPRDALGKSTPKREWALREALAEQGKDRHEVEAGVARAYAEGLIEMPKG